MTGLLGPNGRPISSTMFKKAPPPKAIDQPMARWGGEDIQYFRLPGGATLQFNLDLLTLPDYRAMRDHYQINANLSVLTFMMHQVDWHIVSDNKQQAQKLEDILRGVWTRLVRAASQAFWAGYSPSVLEYENDVDNMRVTLNKVKDLVPEECRVNWKLVPGWNPNNAGTSPNIPIYNGIRHFRAPYPYPVDNTFWYPLLMEHGNHYGKKLLRPAFAPWFFSQLIHLFSNRYYERYGEPTPIGRADFDDTVTDETGTELSGRDMMAQVLQNLRNRSTVVLPSTLQQISPTRFDPVYNIEYLESQMRGADFERYLTRLDEEMSLSLFTPVLLLRTADVGSYNLGVGHMQLWMWMLNALAGDLKEYVDRYIVTPLKNYNFGVNAPECRWEFKQWGRQNVDIMRALVTALATGGTIKPDLNELGDIIGLSLSEVAQVTEPPPEPGSTPPDVPGQRTPDNRARTRPKRPTGVDKTAASVNERIRGQVTKAFSEGRFGDSTFVPSLGYRRKFENTLLLEGFDDAEKRVTKLYEALDAGLKDLIQYSEASNPDEFMNKFERFIDDQVDNVCT